ncbi:hypothetical protein RR46_09116 [Papilio xuthus]|uniref:Uncharacterized protein n=1 Tax=Papilio xuthus TaxID=66420 RepID=A0A194PWS2_PAPXU|nr:hypothetical protein RR46_09116 [Papilio xuthus]
MCDDYCSRIDSIKRQDNKSNNILTAGKCSIDVRVDDNEEIKLCGDSKTISKEKSDKEINKKKCANRGYVSLSRNKTIVYMCDANDKDSGKSSDECDCDESSSSQGSSSCNCVCIPCDGEENLCIGINVKGKIEVCDDCSCGQEDKPKTCDNKKCDKKNCVCIQTRGKAFVCVGIDDKGTIMCYSDCTCENDCKQGSSKSKSVFVPSGASCICVCLDDNRKVTPCFDCSCKEEENKEQNCEGCSCIHEESLPVLLFTDDTSNEVKKAILEDKSTNTSCADCLCDIPRCTSYKCICPPDTNTVTIVKKFADIGDSHDCNCPEPKGTNKSKCCKRK